MNKMMKCAPFLLAIYRHQALAVCGAKEYLDYYLAIRVSDAQSL